MVAITNVFAASILAASAMASTTCTEGAKPTSTHPSPKPTSHPAEPEPITIFSIRSGSPIMYEPLNAIGGQFFLGGSPSAYCPPQVEKLHACPSGNYTVLEIIPSTGTAALDVVVPGGQQIYIAKTGQLSYTQPHSAFIPSGAITTGFKIGKPAANTLQEVTAVEGFLACPKNSKNDASSSPYQVFVDVKGFTDKQAPSGKKSDCLGFGAFGHKFTAETAGAWEY